MAKGGNIYYVGFFKDSSDLSENRHICPAGVNKMNYISKSLVRTNDGDVTIVSLAGVVDKSARKVKYYSGYSLVNEDDIKVIMPPSLVLPTRVMRFFTYLFTKMWFIKYSFFNIRKDDTVVVYNSPFYFNIIRYLKRIIGFNLVLEVEEVYSRVFNMPKRYSKREDLLIKIADSYIFANDLAAEALGLEDKASAVAYGNYNINNSETESLKFNDGKIHLVYAGIIDKLKCGAFYSVDIANYLSSDYVIHILGFGNDNDINDLKNTIDNINSVSDCKVVYEGVKHGDDYVKFIKGCHVGLSPLSHDAKLETAYPSKVLNYLSLGINVVSTGLDIVTSSKILDIISISKENSGESFANAIKNMEMYSSDYIYERLNMLDRDFVSELNRFLK